MSTASTTATTYLRGRNGGGRWVDTSRASSVSSVIDAGPRGRHRDAVLRVPHDGVQRAAQLHEAGGAVGSGPERRHGVDLADDAPELRLDMVADERVQLLRLADGDAGDRHAQAPVLLRRAGIMLGHLAELVQRCDGDGGGWLRR